LKKVTAGISLDYAAAADARAGEIITWDVTATLCATQHNNLISAMFARAIHP
jgi:hypothetical protein